MQRVPALALALGALTMVPSANAAPATSASPPSPDTRTFVFAGEGNRLHAYDAETGVGQVVIPSANDAEADPELDADEARDINAQICFREIDGETYFVAGEDTGQGGTGSPGWGWFHLDTADPDAFGWTQLGKLVPTWSGSSSNPENYGCGFLGDGRLVTSDVGDQLPHEEASGQLIVWFPSDEAGGFSDSTADSTAVRDIENTDDTNYCKIDTSIGTAGGVWVDDEAVFVASNRPGPNGPGGVYRYDLSGFPTTNDCAGHGTEADLVDAGVVERELWLPSDAFVLTPSAIAPTGKAWNGFPTWYVSSVFTGVIAEYADTGTARVHVRNVVESPAGLPIGQLDDLPANDGGTPYGLGVTPDGDLWYADLGIQGAGPAGGHGSVQRVQFDDLDQPHRTIVDDGQDFTDGIGVVTVEVGAIAPTPVPGVGKGITSERPCPDWGMYGGGAGRTFSTDCETSISPNTVAGLVPKWVVKTDKTVTASPAVADGRLFVGDWSGTMYAVDTETGDVAWTFEVAESPGAAFGPIVSSAAVADVKFGSDLRRLVIFGAGPRLYALDAADGGSAVWVHELVDPARDALPDDTPIEIESSPVVHDGTVYVGIDTHNREGTGVPGGLLALDARTGTLIDKFEPELGQDRGCGGVWSSPAVDRELGLVFIGTANCPRPEEGDGFDWNVHIEAVTALTLDGLDPVWAFSPHEPFNDDDHDFGATPNVFVDAEGRRVVGAGNKNGHYYVLDAATGALLHDVEVSDDGFVQDGFAIGGYLGSPAVLDGRVFGGTAIPTPQDTDESAPFEQTLQGIYASVDPTAGEVVWRAPQAPSYAASAGVNGVVFHGALDNVFRAYEARTGRVLWAAPLLGPISSGAAISDSRVFVGSGTSSSDACAKETGPLFDLCLAAFDEAVGSTGGIHAFELPPLP